MNSKRGFTLIELAITLLILSVLLGGYFKYNETSSFEKADEITRLRMDYIEKAILSFYNQNGFIPCPARLNDTGATVGASTDCSVAAAFGPDVYDTDSSGDGVRAGAVPYKNLNIPTEYLLDGFGNRFRYTAVRSLAISPRLYNNFTPALTNNPIILIYPDHYLNADVVPYTLVSLGADGRGAYAKNGVRYRSCGGASVINCGYDNVFVYALRDMSVNPSTGFTTFDDYLTWKTYKQLKTEGDFNGSGKGFGMKYLLAGSFFGSGTNLGSSTTFDYRTNPTLIWNSSKRVTYSAGDITINGPGNFTIRATVLACSSGLVESMLYDGFSGNSIGGTTIETGAAGSPTSSCAPTVTEHTINLTTGQSRLYYLYVKNNFGNGTDGGGRSVNVAPGNYFSYIEVLEESN